MLGGRLERQHELTRRRDLARERRRRSKAGGHHSVDGGPHVLQPRGALVGSGALFDAHTQNVEGDDESALSCARGACIRRILFYIKMYFYSI